MLALLGIWRIGRRLLLLLCICIGALLSVLVGFVDLFGDVVDAADGDGFFDQTHSVVWMGWIGRKVDGK